MFCIISVLWRQIIFSHAVISANWKQIIGPNQRNELIWIRQLAIDALKKPNLANKSYEIGASLFTQNNSELDFAIDPLFNLLVSPCGQKETLFPTRIR